jgi:HEAT repeat protein
VTWKVVITALIGSSLAVGQTAPSKTESSWDVLKKGLQDSNPEKRKLAAMALMGTGINPTTLQLLYDALANDKDPEVRQAAASSLGELKARAAIPKLKTAIENDPPVSFAAARALWIMGDHSAKDLIEEVATGQQKNATGKMASAKLEANRRLHDPNGLAKTGAEQAAYALLGPFSIGMRAATELAKDAGAQSRLLAITLLSQQCDAESVSSIETAMEDDKNDTVRAGAAKALGICGARSKVDKLMLAVMSEKYPVQIAAAASVIHLSSGPAKPGASPPDSLKKQ